MLVANALVTRLAPVGWYHLQRRSTLNPTKTGFQTNVVSPYYQTLITAAEKLINICIQLRYNGLLRIL